MKKNMTSHIDNWLTNWGTAYRFISDSLGEEGLEKFKELAVEFIKSTIPMPAVQMLESN